MQKFAILSIVWFYFFASFCETSTSWSENFFRYEEFRR